MLPAQRNFRPRHSSQFQNNGIAPSAPPQIISNSGSFMGKPTQVQPQMPIPSNNSNPQLAHPGSFMGNPNQVQPQIPIPSNNSNPQLAISGSLMANPTQVQPQMPIPSNNSNPQLAHSGSFMTNPTQVQLQMPIPSNNSNAQLALMQLFQSQMSQMNGAANAQQNGQLLAQNGVGPPQFLNNQNVGFGGFPNPMQNLNQLQIMQLQQMAMIANFAQFVPAGGVPLFPGQASQGMGLQNPGGVPLFPNQVSQGMGLQNPTFALNANLGIGVNVQQTINENFSRQMAVATQMLQQLQGQSPQMMETGRLQQLQGQSPQMHFPRNMAMATEQLQFQGLPPQMNSFSPVQQPQTQNLNAHASADTQANPGFAAGHTKSPFKQNNSYKNNLSRDQKHGAKYKKSKFGKRKFSMLDPIQEEGHDGHEEKIILPNTVKPEREKTRSLMVTYSEQEIRQWQEDRRKKYPSKANIEKKLRQKSAGDSSSAAKLQRQQLKEILAKQAELGFEPAEVPASYLSDSEKQDRKWNRNDRSQKGNDRCQKKFNKRGGKFNPKRRRFGKSDSSNTCDQEGSAGKVGSAREPTLLKKLLSSDIRRDKRRLLQVFRFMTMNSFFQDGLEKPLRFPHVKLKETWNESDAAEEEYDAMEEIAAKSLNDSENDDENNIAELSGEACELQEDDNTENNTDGVDEVQENADSESEELEDEQ